MFSGKGVIFSGGGALYYYSLSYKLEKDIFKTSFWGDRFSPIAPFGDCEISSFNKSECEVLSQNYI